MKKSPLTIASIRINKQDWEKFAKITKNRSEALRDYIRSIVRLSEKK